MRGGRRILLVEDDQDLVSTLYDVLRDEGCVVFAASSGEAAISLCREQPAVAFVDLHIDGGVSAETLIAALRSSLPYGAKVYLLSAENDLAARAEELGADGYLEKPFTIDDLLALVDHPDAEAAASPL